MKRWDPRTKPTSPRSQPVRPPRSCLQCRRAPSLNTLVAASVALENDGLRGRSSAAEPPVDGGQPLGLPFPGIVLLDESAAIPSELRALVRSPFEQIPKSLGDGVGVRG